MQKPKRLKSMEIIKFFHLAIQSGAKIRVIEYGALNYLVASAEIGPVYQESFSCLDRRKGALVSKTTAIQYQVMMAVIKKNAAI